MQRRAALFAGVVSFSVLSAPSAEAQVSTLWQ